MAMMADPVLIVIVEAEALELAYHSMTRLVVAVAIVNCCSSLVKSISADTVIVTHKHRQ